MYAKLTAAGAAALIAAIVISGCGQSSSTTTTTSSGTTTSNGSSATHTATTTNSYRVDGLYQPPVNGTCYVWPFVGTLRSVIFPLQQAISGTTVYGYGSSQANSDDMAVHVAMIGLAGDLHTLTPDWGEAILNNVIMPGQSGQSAQMSTAVSHAVSLANDISNLCYIP
jgi:hypothetical protein